MFEILKQIEAQVNGLSEGRITNKYNATTAVPTTGSYQIGDFVPKSNVVEAGGAGSKYIITGWICTDDSPLTFREARVLTGN